MLQVLGVDLKKGVPYNSGCDTIKYPHCPMAMSADYIVHNLQPFTGNGKSPYEWKIIE